MQMQCSFRNQNKGPIMCRRSANIGFPLGLSCHPYDYHRKKRHRVSKWDPQCSHTGHWLLLPLKTSGFTITKGKLRRTPYAMSHHFVACLHITLRVSYSTQTQTQLISWLCIPNVSAFLHRERSEIRRGRSGLWTEAPCQHQPPTVIFPRIRCLQKRIHKIKKERNPIPIS